MAYAGWLCFGGTPIIDACATVAYGRNSVTGNTCLDCVSNDCGCCGPLHAEDVYTDVAGTGTGEPAPWYDPAVPESEGFFGLLATSITGLEPGETTREMSQRATGQGAFIGRETQAGAIITVRAMIMAGDCCSAEFGMRWLSSTLRDACVDCDGSELIFYGCCPGECDPGSPGESPGEVGSCERFRRTLYGVSMISSPKIIDEALADEDSPCGCMYEVEFQLGATNPCLYSEPAQIGSEVPFVLDTSDDCRFDWVSQSECADAGCQPTDPCFVDPGCGPTTKPPQPSSPTLCGTCDPWDIATACVDMETGSVPLHAEGVPIITLNSGTAPMRSTTIRFYSNPLGTEGLDECAACSELTITRIPEESSLVIDGVRREITLSCTGGAPVDASRLLAAGGGALPFVWPVITCPGQTWTICAETDGGVVAIGAGGATMDVAIVAREC